MLRNDFELISVNKIKKAEWVIREIYSACDCFRCKNKLDHKFVEFKIAIYCLDPCNYKPIVQQDLEELNVTTPESSHNIN
jgi:hypothetical protein